MRKRAGEEKSKALRVGVFLEGRLIEEHLFEKPQTVSIGRSRWRNKIVVQGIAAPNHVRLFSKRAGGFCLNASRQMRARIALCEQGRTRMVDVSNLARSARDGGGGRATVPLDPRMRGKLHVGELTLLFHFTSSSPREHSARLPAELRGGWLRGAHPLAAAALALSALLQIGFLGWVLSQDWPEPLDDRVRVDNEFARIMRIPPPDDEPDAPALDDPAPGPSGDDSATEAQEPDRSDDEREPAPELESAPADRLRMSEQVERETMLGILTARSEEGEGGLDGMLAAAAEQDVDAAFAGSTKVRTGRLGDGDLAEQGERDSGGGRAVGVGGLERAPGARKAGGGIDTGDTSEEAVECQGCRMEPLPEEPSDPNAFADPEAISSAIKRIEGRIQGCYERKAKQYPQLAGKVVVTFEITSHGSRGRVASARASVDSVGQGVGDCVAREIRRLRLPAPRGERVMVNKAFVFERGG